MLEWRTILTWARYQNKNLEEGALASLISYFYEAIRRAAPLWCAVIKNIQKQFQLRYVIKRRVYLAMCFKRKLLSVIMVPEPRGS